MYNTTYEGKTLIKDYYAILYNNRLDMYRNKSPLSYGQLWEVERDTYKSSGVTTYSYIGKRVDKGDIQGIVIEFTRLYQTKKNFRIVRLDVIKDVFPEDFV